MSYAVLGIISLLCVSRTGRQVTCTRKPSPVIQGRDAGGDACSDAGIGSDSESFCL